MGRIEADRKIRSESWSSSKKSTEQTKPFLMDGEVCSKNAFDRAGIVRDVRLRLRRLLSLSPWTPYLIGYGAKKIL